MKELETRYLSEVGGGLNGAACEADALGGFGIGATVGGSIGLAAGPAGGAIGAALGGLVGGSVAVSDNANCVTADGSAAAASAASASTSCSAATSCCADSGDSGGGGGGGGGGKVICTELCRVGEIDHEVWLADIRYSRQNFSERTMRGYHLWGVPYVRGMRRYPVLATLVKHPTRWFAEDIAFLMGVRPCRNLKGWVLRELLFRPLCTFLGAFSKTRDWRGLWSDGDHRFDAAQ